MLIKDRISYGKSLANMGFTHHNIIRFRRYDKYRAEDSIVNDLSSDKLNYKQVDWYMQNLVTRSLTDSMGYFTKHIGKSLSYHNLYT